jgi:glycerate kinase
LGYGLLSFCNAVPMTGFELFARHTRLDEIIKQADLVLTAEGTIDRQTLMGKGVGEIGLRCRKHRVPCLAFAGKVAEPDQARQLFLEAHALTPDFTSLQEAMANPGPRLQGLVAQTAKHYQPDPSR